jgi:hypothetical protein
VWSYGWGTSYDLYFGDVTGDGKADLVGRLKSTGDVYVFASTGSGFAFSNGPGPGGTWSYGWSSGYDLFLADLNGDGRMDLVSRYFGPSAGTGNIEAGISTGSGFTYAGLWTYGYSAGYDMYFADATGDGRADLIARYTGNGDVFVMRSTGTSFVWDTFSPWTVGWGSTYNLVFRDVTGDGKADLLGRHSGNGSVFVARSTGAAFQFLGAWATGIDASFEIY